MGVKVNSTESSGSGKLYTGIAEIKVTSINPTKIEMEAMGMKPDKDPKYTGLGKDKNKTRIAVFVEGEDNDGKPIKIPMAFFLEDRTIDKIWLDKNGNFNSDQSKLQGTPRNPYVGEIELLQFIQAWCNVKKGEELALDSIEQIIKGNVKELRQILQAAKNNTFKVLLGVREYDGKQYQDVYMRKFERSFSSDFSWMHKSLKDNEQYLRADYGPIDMVLYDPVQFVLREWKQDSAGLAEQASTASSANGVSASETSSEPEASDDEAPF
jgi:hypothetical protein